MNFLKIFLLLFILYISQTSIAQISLGDDLIKIDYTSPKSYEIGGITVSGTQYLDNNVLTTLSGLNVGETIDVPGEKITKAIQNLWKQGLFENIKISASKIQGSTIFLDIYLEEKPRMSKFTITGVRKSQANTLKDKIKLTKGDVITDNTIINTKNRIKNYFIDKGYSNVNVDIIQKKDTNGLGSSVILFINIKKNNKVKINQISFVNNSAVTNGKLHRLMKKTKEQKIYRIFTTSKYIQSDFKEDKIKIIDKYNELGYRDAKITKDSIYKINNKQVNINITIDEGNKYYFRNISWVGNTKYKSEELSALLKIKKGDIYNQKRLETNLYMNPDGQDVSSLYLDDGYLFFNVNPVETKVENDSIDLEFRVYEGKQARINKIIISGNTKTNDKVILREIRTRPGQLFNRSDIIRSQRELAQLKYFNAEKIGINPKPNPKDETVDIEYTVEETSSDQVELSGGWGGGRVVGTLGLSFNNFSARNFFKKGSWRPLPSGDGQKVSLRAQSNGVYYQSYNASFTEPWLGGKKPNSLSFSIFHTVQSNGVSKGDATRQAIYINGITVGLGKRIKWPDDFFTLYQDISYQNYILNNYALLSFPNGRSNNISYSFVIGRNSVDAPIFPRSGSALSLSVKFTPPYSLFSNKDYANETPQEKYKFIEYHKWNFAGSWFTKLMGNFVLNSRMKYGFMGLYNRAIGMSPFGRYYLGGDGLSGYALDDREIVALRGYSNYSLTPKAADGITNIGGTIFNKYTLEIRFPVSLNPMATIYLLGFAEAGNAWYKFKDFNPLSVKRSVGVGLRLFLPMFGQLGLDWGYGLDDIPGDSKANKGQFHFSIGQSIE